PRISALPRVTAESLSADSWVLEPAEFFDVLEGFENRIGNRVDILFVVQEEVVWEPDGLMVGRPFGGRAAVQVSQIERSRPVPAQRRILGRVYREQRALVNRLVEEPVAGNALQLQRRHQCR